MKKRIYAALVLAAMALLLASAACAEDHVDHTFGSYRTKRSATCTQTGLQFRYCTGCDHWEKRELPKLPHTPGEWEIITEPTCTAKGMQQTYCTECGSRVRKSIDMLPHTYGEMTVVQEPTCTANGKGQYTCEVCGKKKSVRIDKLGHEWEEVEVSKEPTCKAYGSSEQVCLRCERTQTVRIDKLEHVWDEWVIVKEPGGKMKGVRERTCTLCGDQTTEHFYWEGTLYEDMAPSEDVILLQEMLRDLGYYSGSIRSGKFGALTGKAVAKFQKDHGLEETQVADPDTLELIKTEWEKTSGADASGAQSE